MTIGERIRAARKKNKISQVELSQITGLSQSTISAIERGENEPATASLGLIAKALNCTVGELVGETEQLTDGDALRLSPWEREIILALRRTGEQGRMMISNALSVPYAIQAREA